MVMGWKSQTSRSRTKNLRSRLPCRSTPHRSSPRALDRGGKVISGQSHRMRRQALLLLCALGWAALVAAQVPVPPLTGHVTDQTGTLSAEQRRPLEQTLTAFETRKGSQIAVLMIASTAPEEIEQYALRVAEQWKLGRRRSTTAPSWSWPERPRDAHRGGVRPGRRAHRSHQQTHHQRDHLAAFSKSRTSMAVSRPGRADRPASSTVSLCPEPLTKPLGGSGGIGDVQPSSAPLLPLAGGVLRAVH